VILANHTAARGLTLALALVTTGITTGITTGPVAHAAQDASLRVVQQNFNVGIGADSPFTLVLALPAGLTNADLSATGATVKIAAYESRRDPAKVRSARAGSLESPIDSLEIPLDQTPADFRVSFPTPDQLALVIPVEAVSNSDPALWLPAQGVYPVSIDISSTGHRTLRTVTFVHRLAGTDEQLGDLPVALLFRPKASPTIGTNGDITLASTDLTELGRLADVLDTLDAVTTISGDAGSDGAVVPRAVSLQPSVLAALQLQEPALGARLIPLLEHGTSLAGPKLPFDLSAATASHLEPLYTTWLRDGENELSVALPGTRVDRSLLFVDDAISEGGVGLARDLGMRAVVMSPQRYVDSPGNIGAFADPSQLQNIGLSDGSTVPVVVVDQALASQLDATPDDPFQAAIDVTAQLLAFSYLIDDVGGSSPRHGLVLARSDASVPDPALMKNLVPLLATTDGLRLVDPTSLLSIMSTQLIDGQPSRPMTMPANAGPDLTARVAAVSAVAVDQIGTVSMLPDDDPRPAAWQRVVDALTSTALSDADVEQMIAALRGDFDEYRNGVVAPAGFTFTLTGTSSEIRFRLRNTTDTTLTVRVQLDSPKLIFPDGDQIVELAAQESTEVLVRVEARSNGTTPVRLTILTPVTDHELAPDVILTAQVRALTGLGQLITGAFLLVLLTWWARHWRIGRRRKLSAPIVGRHPSGTASNLPPS
jgi:hypothetical protein